MWQQAVWSIVRVWSTKAQWGWFVRSVSNGHVRPVVRQYLDKVVITKFILLLTKQWRELCLGVQFRHGGEEGSVRRRRRGGGGGEG